MKVNQTTNNFRVQYGLIDADETAAWLDGAGLTWDEFVGAMADMTATEKMERVYKLEVDAGMARLIKLADARRRTNDARAAATAPTDAEPGSS